MNKSYNDLIEETCKQINTSGITLSSSVIRMVVDTYKQVRIDTLSECDSYDEDGIGNISVARRKLSTVFNPKHEYSASIKTVIYSPLWSLLTERVNSKDPKYNSKF